MKDPQLSSDADRDPPRSAFHDPPDFGVQFARAAPVGVTDDRHQQATVGLRGDAEVDAVQVDDLLTVDVDPGVQLGIRRSPATLNRATIASRLGARRPLSDKAVRRFSRSVASTSTQVVASGISARLRVNEVAMAFRIPLRGITPRMASVVRGSGGCRLLSPDGPKPPAGSESIAHQHFSLCCGALAGRSTTARSTSSRVISPSGPLPVIAVMSMC